MLKGPVGPVLSYHVAKTFQIVAKEEKFFD